MKNLLFIILTIASTSAFADGFVCESSDNTLGVKVFNHTSAAFGTRSGAVMVLSNLRGNDGEKTIARFDDAQNTLESQSVAYFANVDLRRTNDLDKDAQLKEQVVLQDVNTLELQVDFTYSHPVAEGVGMDGVLTINKRDGTQERLVLDCVRYLKN